MATPHREPILSPDEVRAILDSSTSSRQSGLRSDPESVDLLASDRYLQLMIPALSVGYVRLAEALRKVLTSVLRAKVEVRDEPAEIMTGRGLSRVAETASALLALRTSVDGQDRGYSLLALDSRVTFGLIERLFGGSNEAPAVVSDRCLTALERRVLQHALAPVVECVNANLEPAGVFALEGRAVESKLDLIPGFTPDTTVLHIPFTMTLEDQLASISLAFPATVLEPLRGRLCAPMAETAPDASAMSTVVSNTPVRMSVELGSAKMRLRDVLSLEPGSIIRLDRHPKEELPVRIESLTKFHGLPMHDDGALAIEITRRTQ